MPKSPLLTNAACPLHLNLPAATPSAILRGMVFTSTLRAVTTRALPIALLALLAIFPVLRADELKLKDGTTITGTIVGFEENSFKVKTSYGFAEVQKDQVVAIVISAGAN